jgi:C4-dicarboxylate transporter DctQ subunit
VLVNQLSPAHRKPVVLFSLFCGVLFTAVIGTMGLKFVMELYETSQVTADLEAPRWIVFSAIPAGSYLMCFRFLQVAWSFWRTGDLPHHDESRVEGVEIDETPDAQPPSPAGAAR